MEVLLGSEEQKFVNDNHGLEQQNNCFLCDSALGENDESRFLFEFRFKENGVQIGPLSDILGKVLNQSLEEILSPSKKLCESCCSMLVEYELCQNRIIQLNEKIVNLYNCTLESRREPIVIFTNNVEPNHLPSIKEEDAAAKLIENTNYKVILTFDEILKQYNDFQANHGFTEIMEDSLEKEKLRVNINDKEIFSLGEILKDSSNFPMSRQVITNNFKSVITKNELDCNKASPLKTTNPIPSKEKVSEQTLNERAESDVIIKHFQEADDNAVADTEAEPEVYLKQGDNYVCLVCRNGCELDAKSFIQHMHQKHNHLFINCEYCTNRFVSKRDLIEHLESAHIDETNIEKLTCNLCQTPCDSVLLLKEHMQTHREHTCKVCSKKCNSKALLDEHMNRHTGERPFKCEHCSKGFTSKYTLHAHLRTHTERSRPYSCDICLKSFYNQQHLKQHKLLHTNSSAVTCEICSKTFSTQHNLNLHMVVHSNNKPYKCKICDKSFARKPEIKDHERTHSGERPFRCDMCPMAFAQRSNLASHKKSTHFNEKQHRCDICSRSFKRRRLLDYHIQAVHTGERPHKCDICSAAFVYPEHLKKHVLIHSGQKPYACELCGKTFSSRENRNAHRFVHSEKKLYECMECGSGFMRKPLLLAHMKQTNHQNDSIIINQPCFDKNADDSCDYGENMEDLEFENSMDFNFIEVVDEVGENSLEASVVDFDCDSNVASNKGDLEECVKFLEYPEVLDKGPTSHKIITEWDDLFNATH